MAIRYENTRITLTEETASSFLSKLKQMDPDIIRKKNDFLNESKKNIRVEKTSKGDILIINKN